MKYTVWSVLPAIYKKKIIWCWKDFNRPCMLQQNFNLNDILFYPNWLLKVEIFYFYLYFYFYFLFNRSNIVYGFETNQQIIVYYLTLRLQNWFHISILILKLNGSHSSKCVFVFNEVVKFIFVEFLSLIIELKNLCDTNISFSFLFLSVESNRHFYLKFSIKFNNQQKILLLLYSDGFSNFNIFLLV